MHCTNCGAEMENGASLCPACGADMTQTAVANPEAVPTDSLPDAAQSSAEPSPAEAEELQGDPLIGWSDKLDDPAIQKMALRQKKSARMFGIIFGIIFPVGFIVAGFLIKTIPLKLAVMIGFGLGLLMVAVSYIRLCSLNKPIWEGTVADKTSVEHYDKKNKDKARVDYTVVFRGNGGGKKKLHAKNDSSVYEYYNVGDKVRFYPVFGTFEKRDKSHDEFIFCNVCSSKNPIANRKCERCKSPLFK